MIARWIALDTFSFAEPRYLALLIVPGVLLALLCRQVLQRRSESRVHLSRRVVPVREKVGLGGDLGFWIGVLLASGLCVLALAQPRARVAAVTRTGADLIVLQDASASMYVNDVLPNRWQRSQLFMRELAEALSWKGDRVALALFANRAAPQIRLTRDPNSLFFFLDHLDEYPPFSLENDTTWDTNIAEGLSWGMKLISVDEDLFGASENSKAFVVISDGQSWSGKTSAALELAREQRIPVYVIGVGTTSGGMIPEPRADDGTTPKSKVRSVLDRASLQNIANFGGGQYFELGRQPDRDIAFRIVASVRDRAARPQQTDSYESLHWRFLAAAGVTLVVGTLLLKRTVELHWQAAGVLGAGLLLVAVL